MTEKTLEYKETKTYMEWQASLAEGIRAVVRRDEDPSYSDPLDDSRSDGIPPHIVVHWPNRGFNAVESKGWKDAGLPDFDILDYWNWEDIMDPPRGRGAREKKEFLGQFVNNDWQHGVPDGEKVECFEEYLRLFEPKTKFYVRRFNVDRGYVCWVILAYPKSWLDKYGVKASRTDVDSKAVLDEYEEFLDGDVYWYAIEKKCESCGTWKPTEDSCGGFIGSDFKENGIDDHIRPYMERG